ncbi:unnamed protein product [Ectocarpus sp. 13 AM-2016]
MAEVLLPVIVVLTTTKSFLVVDAVFFNRRGSSALAHGAHSIFSHVASEPSARSTSVASRQKRPSTIGHNGSDATKARDFQVRLVAMHVIAVLGQVASSAKYLLPVSNASCTVTYETMLVMALFFDVSADPVVVRL